MKPRQLRDGTGEVQPVRPCPDFALSRRIFAAPPYPLPSLNPVSYNSLCYPFPRLSTSASLPLFALVRSVVPLPGLLALCSSRLLPQPLLR